MRGAVSGGADAGLGLSESVAKLCSSCGSHQHVVHA